MHRILGTQIILHKKGVADSNKCLLCRSTSEETLLHLFFSCPKANQLWHQLANRIFNKTGFYIQFSPEDVLLGYIYHNSNSAAINTLIMVIKCYIYTYSRKGKIYFGLNKKTYKKTKVNFLQLLWKFTCY